jgi:hypothetical protein
MVCIGLQRAMAAVFAVSPHPSRGFVLLLFLRLFCWEIGGQNVPADWHDLEEDQRRRAELNFPVPHELAVFVAPGYCQTGFRC